MAARDMKVVKNPGGVLVYNTEDRTTSSQTTTYSAGEPLKVAGTETNFVYALATGDPEVGTDEFVGLANSTSTETSTADGTVEVQRVIPVATVIRGKATTAGNIDTAAKLLAVTGDWVAVDVTGAGTNGPTGVFTFDEDEGTDPNVHGFKILAGDTVRGTLDCCAHGLTSEAAPNY